MEERPAEHMRRARLVDAWVAERFSRQQRHVTRPTFPTHRGSSPFQDSRSPPLVLLQNNRSPHPNQRWGAVAHIELCSSISISCFLRRAERIVLNTFDQSAGAL